MKRLIAILFVFALVAPMTGCFHNQIMVDPNYNPSQTTPDFEHGWQIHLIGLIDLSGPVELTQVCPQGAGLLEVERTFVNGLVTAIVPLVSFQTRRVYCQSAPAAAALSSVDVNE